MDSSGVISVELGHFERDFMFDFDLQGQQLFINHLLGILLCPEPGALHLVVFILQGSDYHPQCEKLRLMEIN